MPKNYLCYRADYPPSLDGTLCEPVWEKAPWTDDFVDIEGDLKPAPRFRTRVKMLWDDQFFYIGAYMEEPDIWATLTEHDSVIFQDNDFEVFIDPDGDNHDYYEIEINAFNTTWDLRLVKPYRDGGPALNEWEIPGMKTAVHISGTLNDPTSTDIGWSVEMAIPWHALAQFARRPSPPRAGDQWRINFSRVEWDVDVVDNKYRKIPDRREHNWVWSPHGVIDMHRPERWGYVQFSNSAPGTDIFRPDASAPAREFLMLLYYAQRAFKKQHGYFAVAFQDLQIPQTPPNHFAPKIIIKGAGYEASVVYSDNHGKQLTLRVNNDSRLW